MNATLPVPAETDRFCAPLTVDAKEMSPAPAPEFNVVLPVNKTGDAKEIFWLFVVMLPARSTLPAPL